MDNLLEGLDGLFVGMLSDAELEAFESAISQGKAWREYSGASGFMGLAKVRTLAVLNAKEAGVDE